MGWLDALQRKTAAVPDDKKTEQDDLELKTITESVKKVGDLETGLNEIKEKTKVLDRMTSFLDEQEAMKRRRIAEDAVKKANENKESEDKEMEILWLENPAQAAKMTFERESQGLTQAQITMQIAQVQQRIANLNTNLANANALLATLQTQVALFPISTGS